MLYLSEEQSLAMTKIIIKMWSYISGEHIFELKIFALHRLIIVFEKIPLNSACHIFISNYICQNLVHIIKESKDNREILIFAKALHIVLERLLPDKLEIIEKVIPQIISMLIIKKEEGYGGDCLALLNYLLVDMKKYLKNSIDLVDASQGVENSYCSTRETFIDNLKVFVTKLPHYRYEK